MMLHRHFEQSKVENETKPEVKQTAEPEVPKEAPKRRGRTKKTSE